MTRSRGSEPRVGRLAVPWRLRRVGKEVATGGSFVLGCLWAKCTLGPAGQFSLSVNADSQAQMLYIL